MSAPTASVATEAECPEVTALPAQVTARRFSERAGCTAVGGEDEEAGTTHVTMLRRL